MIVNSVTITATNVFYTTINYNFQNYYFQLLDPAANIVTANVTLTIGTAVA